jgi:hypothetical protein
MGESVSAKIEISNIGGVPVLIGNEISTATETQPSHIDFEMKDDHGRTMPAPLIAIDSFGLRVEPDPGIALLKRLLLLNPGYSLTKVFALDTVRSFAMNKPGTYNLSALYSSNGLSYLPALSEIGVTEGDVKSLPYEAWSGKIRTNTVSFKILPSPKRTPQ